MSAWDESGKVQGHDIVGLFIGGGSRVAQKPKVCRALTQSSAKPLNLVCPPALYCINVCDEADPCRMREAELDSLLHVHVIEVFCHKILV